jgi:hypothetical protein
MADLSPAALSVWCRFCEVVEEHGPPRLGLAAALRAAAKQLCHPQSASTLHALADELEGIKYGTYRCNL